MEKDIQLITTQFLSGQLPKEDWTHNAHLAVAFVLIAEYKTEEDVIELLRKQIKTYNESVGTANTPTSGYHETLTVFWIKVVGQFLRELDFNSIEEAYGHFLKTILASGRFPLLFYTREVLFANDARRIYVPPDLRPLAEIQTFIYQRLEQHFILDDVEFEAQFTDSSLPPHLFTHEAHLRLGWIHLKKYGEEGAIHNVCEQIIRFSNHIGEPNLYNATVTIAALKAIHHFMKKKAIVDFRDFIIAYPDLKSNFKDLIAQHYGFDIFNSAEAKARYLEPDLMAFT